MSSCSTAVANAPRGSVNRSSNPPRPASTRIRARAAVRRAVPVRVVHVPATRPGGRERPGRRSRWRVPPPSRHWFHGRAAGHSGARPCRGSAADRVASISLTLKKLRRPSRITASTRQDSIPGAATDAFSQHDIEQITACGGQRETALRAFARAGAAVCPRERTSQVVAVATKALRTEIIRHAAPGNALEPGIDVAWVAPQLTHADLEAIRAVRAWS
jgi:hypothetical protein